MKTKKHVPSTGYDNAHRLTYPLFEPLAANEQAALDSGVEAFREQFPETLLFPDPFLGVKDAVRSDSLSELRIVHGGDAFFKDLGEELASAIRKNWNVDVSVVGVDDADAALSAAHPRLYLGGAGANVRVLEIARKYQVGLFSSEYPGDGGWGLTTHWELEDGFSSCYILSCDPETREEALRATMEHIASPDARLRWAHQVFSRVLGEFDFEEWVSGFKSPDVARLDLLDEWLASGRKRPYREVFVEFFTREYGFPKGLPYNAGFLDIGMQAIRCYQRTGSEQARELFRETLWGFWDYLNSENPQIYISDMDFRMGHICNYWNWIQYHPSFMNEERLIFDRLFLGATRMVRDYFRNNWKDKRAPHNHQTFKARSLVLAWRYFQGRGIPDAATWREDAEFIFRQVPPGRSKFRENAGLYERFVQEHTLTWLEATNQNVPDAMRNALARYAHREWALRDNFLLAVDYGDCDPSLVPERPFEVAPWLDGSTPEQREVQKLEASSHGIFPLKDVRPFFGFTALEAAEKDRELSDRAGWQRCPLDPLFAQEMILPGREAEHFDKLVWRTGWNPQSTYLALEGIGTGDQEGISHAHHEANGILRANLGGRIWLVRSGYGKKPEGLTDGGKIFATRQTGPEEHNMLVMRDAKSGKPVPPPAAALLQDCGEGALPFAVSELENYAGTTWRRHLLILPGAGFVVLDRVTASPEANPELQWNVLGALSVGQAGAVLEQNGTRLVWGHWGTVVSEWRESEIYAWRRLIQNGDYPHTKSMPGHCVQKAAGKAGESCFLNTFWLEGTVDAAKWNAEARELTLTTTAALSETPTRNERPWGQITIEGRDVHVDFSL